MPVSQGVQRRLQYNNNPLKPRQSNNVWVERLKRTCLLASELDFYCDEVEVGQV